MSEEQKAIAKIRTVLFGGLLIYYLFTGNLLLTQEQKRIPPSPPAIRQKAELENEVNERRKKSEKNRKNLTYDTDIGQDFSLSRYIGLIGSLPFKTFFWSRDIGRYPSSRVVKTIEDAVDEKELHGLKIRIGHNDVFQDTARLFTDENVVKRNPGWFRVLVGVPTTLLGEGLSELSRTDYYNPITNAAIIYSNVEGIALHEIGHAKDFSRFKRPWIYTLSRALPPVTLYQEWIASAKYAREDLPQEKKYHFSRFLIPAFATYVIATWKLATRKKQNE